MKFLNFFAIATLFAFTISCTVDKTDFEAELNQDVTEYFEFEEAVSFNTNGYRISVEALNGTFFKGYNEIRLKIVNTQNNQLVSNSEITFLPIMTGLQDQTTSCPHRYNLIYNAEENYYSGYVVFTDESSSVNSWDVYIGFMSEGEQIFINQSVTVETQTNKNLNMTAFTGNDGETYFIALIAPQKPSVAENELVAGIYKYHQPTTPSGTFPDPSQFLYSEVNNYTLLLDPRMPEPSMGNHSSPNNVDLTQQLDGLYYGVVNYTMTGKWTLNFILLDKNGQIIKGTEVPTDFTPGLEGAKSELYIDILF
ncbi:hypothetical protein [Confluentibacter sediminis]|uniref:hypothetical protein n=1 Tax=Confluentibacter sediminis TaxID=2219045 RepID=UPI000DADE670|nr:hypothetical protein [Confluentibacter sediminis]